MMMKKYQVWTELCLLRKRTDTRDGRPRFVTYVTVVPDTLQNVDSAEDLDDHIQRVGYSYKLDHGKFLDETTPEEKQEIVSACEKFGIRMEDLVTVYKCINGRYEHEPKLGSNEDRQHVSTWTDREYYEALQWWSHRPSFIESLEDLATYLNK